MKLPRLLERDLKIVEKKKIWFLIPAAFVLAAVIMSLVWQFTPVGTLGVGTGRAFNISIDFTGGYAMTLRLGDRLTDDTYDYYRDRIATIASEVTPSDEYAQYAQEYQNQPFGLVVMHHEMMRQGEYETHAIYFRYRPLPTPNWFRQARTGSTDRGSGADEDRLNEEFMDYVNEQLAIALSALFAFTPRVEGGVVAASAANTFTITYNAAVYAGFFTGYPLEQIQQRVADLQEAGHVRDGIELVSVGEHAVTLVRRVSGRQDRPVYDRHGNPVYDSVTTVSAVVTGDATLDEVRYILTIPTIYAGDAQHAGMTSATIGTELLISAILAVTLALVLMLIYVAFRFDLSSGASAIIGLVHDVIIMFSIMSIFHIEIGTTFIAALITILGYSLNNTIILFDRVRDKVKPYGSREYNTKAIANASARDTIFRSFATTTTGLFPMLALLIAGLIGVQSIVVFAVPIIVGLLAGTYSTLFILPSSWVGIKNLWFKRQKKKGRLPDSDINSGSPELQPA